MPSRPPGTSSGNPADRLVVDASAIVDLLLGTDLGTEVELRLRHRELHAPAHLDAEVLSALGRLHRAGQLTETQVAERLEIVSSAAIERHPLSRLLTSAWTRRQTLRLVDALYVELTEQLAATLVTTDSGLAAGATGLAELIEGRH